MRIGGLELKGRLALAPMAGVTDAAFRQICREFGAELCTTEMVSAKALTFNDKKTEKLMDTSRDRGITSVQIFGSDVKCMGEAARRVCSETGARLIDINMGCPVGKIVKSGDGSALMLDINKASEIIRAVVMASSVPVTVKFRKGFDLGHVNAVEFAKMCEESGASAVTVHGRTRVQMYSGRADWDIIRRVKEEVSIPVLANGDVFTPSDAVKILDVTGADMAVIGRGAMGSPWIFKGAAEALEGKTVSPEPCFDERIRIALRQIEMATEYKGEKCAILEARKHLAWYIRGMPEAAWFRRRIMDVSTLEDVRTAAQEMLDFLSSWERGRRREQG